MALYKIEKFFLRQTFNYDAKLDSWLKLKKGLNHFLKLCRSFQSSPDTLVCFMGKKPDDCC